MGMTPEGTSGRHAAALTPNRLIPSPAARRWLYASVAAICAVLQVFGLVTTEQLQAILGAVQIVLVVGAGSLAIANTPRGT